MSLAFYGKTVFTEVVRLVGGSRCFTKTAAVMASGGKYTDYVKFLELAGNLKVSDPNSFSRFSFFSSASQTQM